MERPQGCSPEAVPRGKGPSDRKSDGVEGYRPNRCGVLPAPSRNTPEFLIYAVARGGRLNPPELSGLFDQAPPLRDPKTVLIEIAAARAPDAYLRSLHPNHEQFLRLRQALLKARGEGAAGLKSTSNGTNIRRLIINMERWRWMPEDLGRLYVWSDTPEFMLYVVKDGKTIYSDKTQVGTINVPTPVFSANMITIVFNPEWIAPESVLVKDLLPRLRKNDYAILDKHRLSVSYHGDPVNPNQDRLGAREYPRLQIHPEAGTDSNLGKIKFLFPNKHDVLMHDTFAARRKVFQTKMRAIGYGCVRGEAGAIRGSPSCRRQELVGE